MSRCTHCGVDRYEERRGGLWRGVAAGIYIGAASIVLLYAFGALP